MAFDHHSSEVLRNPGEHPNLIINPDAPSAARVVFEHFGGGRTFPESFHFMMEAVDKADSAQFSRDDLTRTAGFCSTTSWIQGRAWVVSGNFGSAITSYDGADSLFAAAIPSRRSSAIRTSRRGSRCTWEHVPKATEQIRRCTTVRNNLVVLDLRREEPIWACNRFMIYALFPEIDISIHVLWGVKRQNMVLAVGKSILKRTSKTNIGALMLEYGGGGHEAAGTPQVRSDDADAILAKLVKTINQDG